MHQQSRAQGSWSLRKIGTHTNNNNNNNNKTTNNNNNNNNNNTNNNNNNNTNNNNNNIIIIIIISNSTRHMLRLPKLCASLCGDGCGMGTYGYGMYGGC